VPDPQFGKAFHILIPQVLIYGYRWSRSGSVAVGKGTFLNIRAFARPYGDYSGPFHDNPYEIMISAAPQKQPPEPSEPAPPSPPQQAPPAPPAAISAEPRNDNTATGTAFADIAQKASGEAVYAADETDTAVQVGKLLDRIDGESLDLVICLDTTGSMQAYMPSVKKKLTPIVRERVAKFKSFRVGIMLYKDYWPEEYITRKVPFTSDLDQFNRFIQSLNPYGGGDVPEAVDEALYAAATEFDWQAQKRLIILVGDAPPHPIPRDKITLQSVVEAASARSIQIDTIIEPLQPGANG
jgi:Mg-chelatase subunit ChlD